MMVFHVQCKYSMHLMWIEEGAISNVYRRFYPFDLMVFNESRIRGFVEAAYSSQYKRCKENDKERERVVGERGEKSQINLLRNAHTYIYT